MDWLSVVQALLSLGVTVLLAATVVCGVRRAWRPLPLAQENTVRGKATLTAGLLMAAACAVGAAFFVWWGRLHLPGASLEQALQYSFPGSMDADHYMMLARYGYGSGLSGAEAFPEQHLMIVFFPLFPLLVRGVMLLTGLEAYTAGLLVQPVLLGLAGAGLYRLVTPRFGGRAAAWTMAVLLCMPGSFFFAAPMTESLYLALTVWALVFLEADRPLGFAALGFLAALTRSTGGLLAGVALVSAVLAWRGARPAVRQLAGAVGPCLGTGLYLGLNRWYYGDWFAFSQIQKEHWSQGLGWVGNTVQYLWQYVLLWWQQSPDSAVYLSLYGLVTVVGACAVLFVSRRRLPVCWLAYGVAYVLVAYGATWLLSAPRYALSLPVLPLGLVLLCKKDWQRAALTVLLLAAWVPYFRQYLCWGPIY